MKEFDKLKHYCKRALLVLLDAAERGDTDQKLLARLSKIVQASLAKSEVISDFDFVEFVVTTVERIIDFSGRPHISFVLTPDWCMLKPNGFDNHHIRLIALDRRANRGRESVLPSAPMAELHSDLAGQGRLVGTVHNVAVGGRYAFVVNREGNRWFTHAHFMRNEEDWQKCIQGTPVSFCIGQNAKGPCAVDVCILD